jgi:hypothetical protein
MRKPPSTDRRTGRATRAREHGTVSATPEVRPQIRQISHTNPHTNQCPGSSRARPRAPHRAAAGAGACVVGSERARGARGCQVLPLALRTQVGCCVDRASDQMARLTKAQRNARAARAKCRRLWSSVGNKRSTVLPAHDGRRLRDRTLGAQGVCAAI